MTTLVTILCALQEGNCFYCGVKFSGPALNNSNKNRERRRRDQWSRDHVLPLSRGGKLYVLSCVGCNSDKSCRLPTSDEFRRAVLLRAKVDDVGVALVGAKSWSTLESEKALVREKIAASHTDHGYRYPREEIRSSKLADALAAA